MKNDDVDNDSFELEDSISSWQVPITVFNGDIESIDVTASDEVGQSGACHIPVS